MALKPIWRYFFEEGRGLASAMIENYLLNTDLDDDTIVEEMLQHIEEQIPRYATDLDGAMEHAWIKDETKRAKVEEYDQPAAEAMLFGMVKAARFGLWLRGGKPLHSVETIATERRELAAKETGKGKAVRKVRRAIRKLGRIGRRMWGVLDQDEEETPSTASEEADASAETATKANAEPQANAAAAGDEEVVLEIELPAGVESDEDDDDDSVSEEEEGVSPTPSPAMPRARGLNLHDLPPLPRSPLRSQE